MGVGAVAVVAVFSSGAPVLTLADLAAAIRVHRGGMSRWPGTGAPPRPTRTWDAYERRTMHWYEEADPRAVFADVLLHGRARAARRPPRADDPAATDRRVRP
ncbi:hypothetical protein [Saccharothrix australiensis]|uniref:hypothetical protein n=1 Tax=Saccharothrix australiensis TaxID=2072 RepID=UPI0011C38C97|nr:hypothetical protein [Saccharothrix australiensis]